MIVEVAKEILENGYVLCDSCLGRLFGLRGYGLSNAERGKAIKTVLFLEAYKSSPRELNLKLLRSLSAGGFEPARIILSSLEGQTTVREKCHVCGGITERYEDIAAQAAREALSYEFKTFQFGVRLPLETLKREEELWRRYKLSDAESLKNEVTREVGKIFSRITGKEYDPEKPDLLIILDLEGENIEMIPQPVFVCGRYRKLVRGLPQNPWPYSDDRIKYKTSIEELIAQPAIELFQATGARFHAGGREDIDVRTLGKGRPFVLELRRPRKRSVNLEELERLINTRAGGLIEVEGLAYCERRSIKTLKSLAEIARKTYRALVTFSSPISDEDIEKINSSFNGVTVEQKTPTRVLHRRADKLRRKVVYRVEASRVSDREIELLIDAQGGFYIKEFIHGDGGRTNPSIAGILGKSVEKIELDVINID
ncbi:MAG: tRNA pseudouridine(54/55) synthase Pus10 [Infirmifilum sp.]